MRKTVLRYLAPWLALALATVAALVDGDSVGAADKGLRVMFLLIGAAIVLAVQGRTHDAR